MPSSRHARGHKGNIAPPSSRMLKPFQFNIFENNTLSVSPALEGTNRWQRQDKDPDSPQRNRNDWWLLTGTWHGRKIWMSQRRHVILSQRSVCLGKVRERQRYCYLTSARAAELDGAGWLGRIKMSIESTRSKPSVSVPWSWVHFPQHAALPMHVFTFLN